MSKCRPLSRMIRTCLKAGSQKASISPAYRRRKSGAKGVCVKVIKISFWSVMMTDQAPALDLSKYVEVCLFGERPHIRGRRVPVATIAYSAVSQGWDVTRLAYEFTLSEAQILSALLYYEEHKSEID